MKGSVFIPTQGFRHAASLLLTNSIRSLPQDGSPALVAEVLARLARDLVELVDDTRAPPEVREWTVEEYRQTLERAAQTFTHRTDNDFPRLFEQAQLRGAEILEGISRARARDTEPRDLFMIYLPEDRLPVAAPLAIELTKRRFTVAFSDYEIASDSELIVRIDDGLSRHRAGALLVTPAFERRGWAVPEQTERFRMVRPTNTPAALSDLVAWLTPLKSAPSKCKN